MYQVPIPSGSKAGSEKATARDSVALNAEQRKVLRMVVDEGKNVFFTGAAGENLSSSFSARNSLNARVFRYRKEPAVEGYHLSLASQTREETRGRVCHR